MPLTGLVSDRRLIIIVSYTINQFSFCPDCRSFEDILRQEECKNVNLTSKPLFCGMNASAMEFVNQTYNASIQQIPISVNSTLLTPKTPSEEYFQ